MGIIVVHDKRHDTAEICALVEHHTHGYILHVSSRSPLGGDVKSQWM